MHINKYWRIGHRHCPAKTETGALLLIYLVSCHDLVQQQSCIAYGRCDWISHLTRSYIDPRHIQSMKSISWMVAQRGKCGVRKNGPARDGLLDGQYIIFSVGEWLASGSTRKIFAGQLNMYWSVSATAFQIYGHYKLESLRHSHSLRGHNLIFVLAKLIQQRQRIAS